MWRKPRPRLRKAWMADCLNCVEYLLIKTPDDGQMSNIWGAAQLHMACGRCDRGGERPCVAKGVRSAPEGFSSLHKLPGPLCGPFATQGRSHKGRASSVSSCFFIRCGDRLSSRPRRKRLFAGKPAPTGIAHGLWPVRSGWERPCVAKGVRSAPEDFSFTA